ncbi:MAG TPA: O-acetylhomoserine aminocarboxypropyltransferase/cysteine synthase [Vicinamibacterales bacterium]|nr:O-acetylhomoserine aminocarboxypropyltransferase/cysteine synthase [Acidobacteriota bacterium]HOC18566.1 O-acetylhomoserine aminocarboxypropyltransferase/cysteine synthase [Vicinamibacterales bacterium]
MSRHGSFGPATTALHGGHTPDPATGACAVPIYQTASYAFESVDQAAALFSLEKPGYIYTRIGNPTTDVLERRLAEMEGGVGALALASGQAAITAAVLTVARAGDNIVSTASLYGGTVNLFHHTLARMGIEARFVDTSDPARVAAAIDDRTRLVYTESIGNPRNNVDDLEALAGTAHAAGVPFVVDNTVTPHLLRPFDHGADLIVYSLTKFVGGHGTSIGGALVDSGRFDWANGRFPEFTSPDPSYHGLVFWDAFGLHDRAVLRGAAFITKARVQVLRDLGACLSPFNAFLFLQGLETLPYRMAAHASNARRVAEWLSVHPDVAWVNYPLLPEHPDHERARRYFPAGAGAIVGFGIRGGREAAERFISGVRLFSHLANIGDAKSLVIHPASTTHQQLTPEQRKAAGVTDDFIRLSVGIEDAGDLIADLEQAIARARKVTAA